MTSLFKTMLNFHLQSYGVYSSFFLVMFLLADGLFILHLRRRRGAVPCLILCAAGCLLLIRLADGYNNSFFSFSVLCLLLFLLAIPITSLCYGTSIKESTFCAVAGYTTQHIASVLFSLCEAISGIYPPIPVQFLFYCAVYALIYLLFARQLQGTHRILLQNGFMLLFVLGVMIVQILLHSYLTTEQMVSPNLGLHVTSMLTNLICSVFIMIVLFNLLLSRELSDSLTITRRMLQEQQKQYQISKETIDLINLKCHDMKHQIRTISQRAAIDPAALQEMEQAIAIYDSIVKTNNQALDIILAEKGLYCQSNCIFISCMVDGKRLDFMSDSDIYALFGNLLDNAIQTVLKLEVDRRIISLTARCEGSLLSINSHNYYDGEVLMEHGIPVTTKDDRDYHGFGIKSMTMIVKKYGGTISFQAKDHVFNLNILFPLEDGRALSAK